MKIPAWLSGLLMVLVVAALWWVVSGDDTEEPTDARPSPSGQAAPPGPGPTPAPPPGQDASGDASSEESSSRETAADEATPEETAAQPPEDEAGWPEPAGVDTRSWDDIDACDDAILPATLIPVVEDIWGGGPYAHPDRDGNRFGNYEGYLPDEDRGYYREFTVETPGLDHRGARRIVTGGWGESDPDVWYYTEDHYESFCEFAP